jgi:hypothetical protein
MTPAEIRARAEKAREFEFTRDGITLTLRVPTDFDVRRAAQAAGGSAEWTALQAPLLKGCVVGWSGIPVSLLASAEEGPMPFAPDLVELVLAELMDLADAAYIELIRRYNERIDAREQSRKN